jgi:hypothetical protein
MIVRVLPLVRIFGERQRPTTVRQVMGVDGGIESATFKQGEVIRNRFMKFVKQMRKCHAHDDD